MGTNFYLLTDERERLHICKRSGAGGGLVSFAFQGIREDVDTVIDSWAKWKVVLRTADRGGYVLDGARARYPGGSGGVLIDEYGHEVDVEKFIAEVEATTPENRSRQYDWVQEHRDEYAHLQLEFDDWLCPDGFSFSYREFS